MKTNENKAIELAEKVLQNGDNLLAQIQFLQNKTERLEREKKEDKEQSFKDLINFAVWYSGMDQSKVVNAYNRYVLEVLNKSDGEVT